LSNFCVKPEFQAGAGMLISPVSRTSFSVGSDWWFSLTGAFGTAALDATDYLKIIGATGNEAPFKSKPRPAPYSRTAVAQLASDADMGALPEVPGRAQTGGCKTHASAAFRADAHSMNRVTWGRR
jgi:hypothetical protein